MKRVIGLLVVVGSAWCIDGCIGDSSVIADAGADVKSSDACASCTDVTVADAAKDASADVVVEVGPPCTSTCGTTNCGACPNTSTSSMLNAYNNVTFKIETREVTNGDYAAFLAANVDPSTQPAVCVGNTSFVPSAQWPAANLARPVEYVDWCDARAFCAWAGRRLCGLIADGGALSSVYEGNADQSEWFSACTGHMGGTGPGGYKKYPYSDTYSASACNGADKGVGATVDAGSLSTCVGSIANMLDMSGNVAEWENNCTGGDAGLGTCETRGGNYMSDAAVLGCASTLTVPGKTGAVGIGFRCCTN